MSLVEVMVAAGLMALVMAGTMSAVDFSRRGAKTSEVAADWAILQSQIQLVLNNAATCDAWITSAVPSANRQFNPNQAHRTRAAAIPLPNIGTGTTPILTVGTPTPSGINVTGIRLWVSNLVQVTPPRFIANLEVTATKGGTPTTSALGAQDLTQTFQTVVRMDAANQIQGCEGISNDICGSFGGTMAGTRCIMPSLSVSASQQGRDQGLQKVANEATSAVPQRANGIWADGSIMSGSYFRAESTQNASWVFQGQTYNTDPNVFPVLALQKARGTPVATASIGDNEVLAEVTSLAHHSGNWTQTFGASQRMRTSASMRFIGDGAWNSTSNPSRIELRTTPAGDVNPNQLPRAALTVRANQSVEVAGHFGVVGTTPSDVSTPQSFLTFDSSTNATRGTKQLRGDYVIEGWNSLSSSRFDVVRLNHGTAADGSNASLNIRNKLEVGPAMNTVNTRPETGRVLASTNDRGTAVWAGFGTKFTRMLMHSTVDTCTYEGASNPQPWLNQIPSAVPGQNYKGTPVDEVITPDPGEQVLMCSLSYYRTDIGHEGFRSKDSPSKTLINKDPSSPTTGADLHGGDFVWFSGANPAAEDSGGGAECQVLPPGGGNPNWRVHINSWNGGKPHGTCVQCQAVCLTLKTN